MIWFCPNRSTLQQASGVYRLFRSWGGEVLYAGHEDDGNIAHILSGIGLPCIVKCAVPFSQAEQYHVNFSERFIAQFISDAIAYPEPSARFDLHTKRDLDPTGVMDIIGFTDPRFPELTGYADWHARYRINPIL
jgi:hypothetical protein